MLSVIHRFHGQNALKRVYQNGKTVRVSMMSLRYARRDAAKPYRASVVVSRKVSKSAVVRNRIRRRLYELVRTRGPAIPPGTDLIFTVFDERVAALPAAELEAGFNELLQKASQRS